MTPDEYLAESASTDIPDYTVVRERYTQPGIAELDHAIRGLTTEIGEMQDALKRFLIYGKPLDVTNLIEEAGDLEWYMSLLLRTLDVQHSEVWQRNINKLRARYPNKFSEHDALCRNLDTERKTLEGDK